MALFDRRQETKKLPLREQLRQEGAQEKVYEDAWQAYLRKMGLPANSIKPKDWKPSWQK